MLVSNRPFVRVSWGRSGKGYKWPYAPSDGKLVRLAAASAMLFYLRVRFDDNDQIIDDCLITVLGFFLTLRSPASGLLSNRANPLTMVRRTSHKRHR